jgi:hypothetical protein
MFNTIVRAGAVRAGAASRYGSGSDQMMRLLAAQAPATQHWAKQSTVHRRGRGYQQFIIHICSLDMGSHGVNSV